MIVNVLDEIYVFMVRLWTIHCLGRILWDKDIHCFTRSILFPRNCTVVEIKPRNKLMNKLTCYKIRFKVANIDNISMEFPKDLL